MTNIIKPNFNSSSHVTFDSVFKDYLPDEVKKYFSKPAKLFHIYFYEQDILKYVLAKVSHYKGVGLDQVLKVILEKQGNSFIEPSFEQLQALKKAAVSSDTSKTLIINYIPSQMNFERLLVSPNVAQDQKMIFDCDKILMIKTYNSGQLHGKYLVLMSSKKQLLGIISLVDLHGQVVEILWTRWLLCGRHPNLVNIGQLDSSHVSRVHCLLSAHENGDLNIIDMMSKNGTSVMDENDFVEYCKTGKPIAHRRNYKELTSQTMISTQLTSDLIREVQNKTLSLNWPASQQHMPLYLNLHSSVIQIESIAISNPMSIHFSAIVNLQEKDSIVAKNFGHFS